MNPVVELLLVLVGVSTLVYGADRAVEGAGALADFYGVSTFFVGVTVVAVGSSLPEIVTSMYAAVYDTGALLVGHIVGSATSQITLGLGVVGLVSTIAVPREKIRAYGAGMVAAMAVMLGVVYTGGTITHVEGAVMVALYVLFLYALFEHEDYQDHLSERPEHTRRRALALLAVGIGAVVVGGHLLVTYGQSFALSVGIPEYLVGVVTGLGTTFPEIVVAVTAVRNDRGGIAVGTLLGSNITDPLFSLGVGAALGEVHVAESATVLPGIAYMLVVSAAITVAFASREEIDRTLAIPCLVLYLPTFLV
ncbi:sodium:calcium antiporter [Halospeciosus flavus]|uniref:Sodium:calcium antiporter n=1 Tax=Halospeciosus flavus TaxID=3032283 RepID=A0ABD5Z8Y6_9EURY|nr:sodium:calcium antiporter [Halospeciosus flavus]